MFRTLEYTKVRRYLHPYQTHLGKYRVWIHFETRT